MVVAHEVNHNVILLIAESRSGQQVIVRLPRSSKIRPVVATLARLLQEIQCVKDRTFAGAHGRTLFLPLTGLITFIAAYFALFWFAWKAAVWLTEPGKRLAKLLSGAAEQKPR